MFNRTDVLIAVALTFTFACLASYPPESGVLALFLGLSFTSVVLWLSLRARDESPDLKALRLQIGDMREELAAVKAQVERLVLGGRRG
jgi:hypothetical protein